MAIARVFAIHVLRAHGWQGQGITRFAHFPLQMVKPDYHIRLQSATAGCTSLTPMEAK